MYLDPPALPMTALIPPDEIKQTLPQFHQEGPEKAPVYPIMNSVALRREGEMDRMTKRM